jgi:dTDP-4-dehydrorhamnose 3,5-epimerase
MFFFETEPKDAVLRKPDRKSDARGYFAQHNVPDGIHGLKPDFVQGNIAHSRLAGTLRGMHFQRVPLMEVKLVQRLPGTLYDVIVDLRRSSPTYRKWQSLELSAENGFSLHASEGFARGYMTLANDTLVRCLLASSYAPTAEDGIRYDDPTIGIDWPASCPNGTRSCRCCRLICTCSTEECRASGNG